jgi:hypothetical protein
MSCALCLRLQQEKARNERGQEAGPDKTKKRRPEDKTTGQDKIIWSRVMCRCIVAIALCIFVLYPASRNQGTKTRKARHIKQDLNPK